MKRKEIKEEAIQAILSQLNNLIDYPSDFDLSIEAQQEAAKQVTRIYEFLHYKSHK